MQEYLADPNATQAAIRAGYSEKTARSIGAENLTKPDIAAAIAKAQAEVAVTAGLTVESHLERLAELAKAAAAANQYAAAITAETNRGKAVGFYVDRRQVTGKDGGPLQVVVRIEREGRRVTAS